MISFSSLMLLLLPFTPKSYLNSLRRVQKCLCSRKFSNFASKTSVVQEAPLLADFQYKQITLRNGMIVTLLHDGITEKSSCCLALAVGASHDPQQYPGLAHFTEHAVFLGSRKYPNENDYKNYISMNGGSYNGGTGMETTTYQFTINSQAFHVALDMFSQFFKSPLFREDSLAREIQAVDSEDSKNRFLDNRRNLQLLKSLLASNSNFSKFSTGNIKTLVESNIELNTPKLARAMKQFHTEHYLPYNMALALVGPQSVDELENVAQTYFSDINPSHLDQEHHAIGALVQHRSHSRIPFVRSPIRINLQAEPSNPTVQVINNFTKMYSSAFPFNETGILIKSKPIKETQEVSILWGIVPTRAYYRTNPLYLLSYILTHRETNTSLYSLLQQKGWAYSVSASVRVDDPDFSIYRISVHMTKEGLKVVEEIVKLIFQCLSTVEKTYFENEKYFVDLWREVKLINEIDFKYQERTAGYDLVQGIVENMVRFPNEHVFSTGWIIDDDFDHVLMDYILKSLTPRRAVVMLCSSDFEWLPDDLINLNISDSILLENLSNPEGEESQPNKIEKYYGIPYRQNTINEETLLSWEASRYGLDAIGQNVSCQSDGHARSLSSYKLPKPNPYISTELANLSRNPPPSLRERLDGLSSSNSVRLHSTFPTKLSELSTSNHTITPVSTPHSAVLIPEDTLWHSIDELFGLPKSVAACFVYTPFCGDGHPANGMISTLYSQQTAGKYHPAAIAGLQYSAGVNRRGFSLSVSGYSPKLSRFMCELCSDWTSAEFWNNIPESLFGNFKARLIQSLQSWTTERPDGIAGAFLDYIISEGSRLPADTLQLAENMDFNDILTRVKYIQNRTKMVMYTHGDMSRTDAEMLFDSIRLECNEALAPLKPLNTTEITSYLNAEAQSLLTPQFELSKNFEVKSRARLLGPTGTHTRVALPTFNDKDPNSALVVYFQAERRSAKISAVLLVINRMLSEPLFTQLRTKDQLGYIVSISQTSYGRYPHSIRGFTIRILSKRFDPVYMEGKVHDFLESYRKVVASWTQAEVRQMSSVIVQSLRETPKSYSEEANLFWDAILEGKTFDFTESVISELTKLTHTDVIDAAEGYIFDPKRRVTLSVMIFGCESSEAFLKLCQQTKPEAPFENSSSVASSNPQHGGLALGAGPCFHDLNQMIEFRNTLNYLE